MTCCGRVYDIRGGFSLFYVLILLFSVDRPNLSSPEKVLSWVKAVAEQHRLGLRREAFNPGPPFDPSPEFGGACWNRELVVTAAVRYFQQVVGLEGAGSTQRNGICATLASRGCGKSFIVDHLCRLRGELYWTEEDRRGFLALMMVNHRQNFGLRHDRLHMRVWRFLGTPVLGALQDCLVPVCISFNGPQDVEVDVRASSKAKLLSRVAHRAILDGNPNTWGRLSRATGDFWDHLDEDIFFQALLLWFQELGVAQPVILLAVDEVIKCGEHHAIEIIALCKSFVSSFTDKCRLLLTTFDNHQLVDGGMRSPHAVRMQAVEKRAKTAGSQRPIEWLPLSPLDVANPRVVLAALRRVSDTQLDFLISLSGGHPRSLALLKVELARDDQRNLIQLVNDWQDQVALYVNDVDDDVVQELLARTLLGETIHHEDIICGASVRSLVQDTVLLNALDPKRHPRFVPQLSLLRLHQWCVQNQGNLQVRLRTLLELGHDLQHRSFEEFHGIFEELRCWAWHKLGHARDANLLEWIPCGRLVRGDAFDVSVPRVELLRTETLPQSLSAHGGSLERCCLAHDNQPGFDVVQPMGQTLLLYECRYSEPPMSEDDTSTRLSPAADVRRKAVIAQEQVRGSQATVDGHNISPRRSAYVLIAHRDSADDLEAFAASCNEQPAARYKKARATWKQFSELEVPVVVLNREALMQRYGPTFKLLGGFMMDYAGRHHE